MLGKRAITVVVSFVAPVVLGGGCSSSSSKSQTPTGTSPVAHFVLSGDTTPNYLDVPFPSDVYLTGGTIVDPIPGIDKVITAGSTFLTHELGLMNGFSRDAFAMFYADPPAGVDGGLKPFAVIDPTSLPTSETDCTADTSAVFLLDLSPATPSAARVLCRAAYHDDTGSPAFSKTRPVVAVGPGRGIVLAEGHQYAAVLTSRVKDTAGQNLAASSDFLAVATGPRTGSVATLYGKAIDTANATLKSALAVDGATIVSIAPFTTNTSSSQLFKLRTTLAAQPSPTLKWDTASVAPMSNAKFAAKVNGALPAGFTASFDDWLGVVASGAKLPDGSDDPDSNFPVRAHDKLAALGTAVFQANNYLSPANSYTAVGDATFSYDASGNIIPNATTPKVPIWVSFAIPSSPMPAAGYPVVIVQHGLGESRADEFVTLANVFANQGWAVAAMDWPTFGARASETPYQVDKLNNFQGAPGGVYTGPDGLADPIDPTSLMPNLMTGSTNGSSDLFGNLLDIGAIRDQMRESEIDITQLVQVLASKPDLSPLQTGTTAPAIDPTHIAYIGNSLGAMFGSVGAAIEPSCRNWVLNVAGGGIIQELAAHGPIVGGKLSLAAGLSFGFSGDVLTESHPAIALIQTVVDPADMLTFADYVVTNPGMVSGKSLPPANVLQVEVVYDEWVPNEANEALARAMGLGMATPNVGSNAGVNTLDLVRAPAMNPAAIPFAQVAPDSSGLIHDTPVKGTTAVLVQTAPAQHGEDLYSSVGHRSFQIPYVPPAYPAGSGGPFTVITSYREVQATVTRFLGDGIAGKVPNVTGFKAPVRDTDGDTYPDSTDADPSNPKVH